MCALQQRRGPTNQGSDARPAPSEATLPAARLQKPKRSAQGGPRGQRPGCTQAWRSNATTSGAESPGPIHPRDISAPPYPRPEVGFNPMPAPNAKNMRGVPTPCGWQPCTATQRVARNRRAAPRPAGTRPHVTHVLGQRLSSPAASGRRPGAGRAWPGRPLPNNRTSWPAHG